MFELRLHLDKRTVIKKAQEWRFSMRTLRLLRNFAVLFIFVMALLAFRPSVSRADNKTVCYYPGKTGFNCNFDSSGNCFETKCVAGQPCSDGSCGAPLPPTICKHRCFF